MKSLLGKLRLKAGVMESHANKYEEGNDNLDPMSRQLQRLSGKPNCKPEAMESHANNYGEGNGNPDPMVSQSERLYGEHSRNPEAMESHANNYVEGNDNPESVKRLFCKLASGQSKQFSYKDLMSYTDNLTTKVGSGGFSTVYKGQYPDGQQIVVKVLTDNEVVEGVFITEVATIATISHRNLVKLHGYCFDHRMKALVYEYMENGSLDQILFTKQHSIEWVKLYGIAIETAKALAYLHEGCDDTIIHHDVKPFNVLLDSKLCAKIADFGLARLKDRDLSHVSVSRARGTPGYGAPEMWMPSSHVTEKCDVYSFGMMLFEIFGRRSNSQINQKWFPKQVWEKFADGKIYKLIEECGIMEKDRERAKILAMIALWCAQFTPKRRPPMSIVVNMLEGRIPVMDPPNPFPLEDTSTHGSDISLFVSSLNEQITRGT